MKLIKPIDVIDAIVVASDVPENDYSAWSGATTYGVGNRVIKAATHRIYESVQSGNIGNDPAVMGSLAWIDIGATNRWAMFDQAVGSVTSQAGSIAVTLQPLIGVNAVGVLEIACSTVRVRVIDGGSVLYDQTKTTATDSDDQTVLTFLDLPKSLGAQIEVTVSGPGTVAVGTLIVGNAFDLGSTEAGPTIGISDFSRRETDDFGVTTVVERAWAKTMSLRMMINTADIDPIERLVVSVRAKPALWVGEDDYDSLAIYGFFKSFAIDLSLPTISYVTLTIEGLTSGGVATPAVAPEEGGTSSFASFDILPNGVDQTDEIHAKFNGGSAPTIRPGSRFLISKQLDRPYMIDVGAKTNFHIDGAGSSIVVVWDPTNTTTIAATLGDIIRVRNWHDCSIANLTIDYSPKIYGAGIVTAKTATSVTILADEPIAFPNADKIERLEPVTEAVTEWQYFRDNARQSNPAPLVDNSDGTYTLTPAVVSASITSIYSYGDGAGNPIVLYLPGNGFTDRQQALLHITTGPLLKALLDGNLYTIRLGKDADMDDSQDDEAFSDYIRLYDVGDEMPINASAAQDFAAGSVDGLGVPSWIGVGDLIRIYCRKRNGNPWVINRSVNCKFDILCEQATALCVAGQNNTDITFPRIDVRNCSAGGFLVRDTEGTINFGDAKFRDIGDNAFNFPATAWDAFIASYADVGGLATFTMTTTLLLPEGWNPAENKITAPRKPKPGHVLEFIDPTGAVAAVRRCVSVTLNVATLDGPLPAGYFPAANGAPGWTIVPRSYAAKFRAESIAIDGCATAGILMQTGDFRIENLSVSRIRAEIVRFSNPGSGRTGPVGYRDGGYIGTIIWQFCGYKLHPRTGSLLTFRRTQSDGQIVGAQPVDPPTHIDTMSGRFCGYGVVDARSARVTIGSYFATNTGLRRDVNLGPVVNNAKYDLHATNNGSIEIGSYMGEAPTALEETGGAIMIAGNSVSGDEW